MNEINKEIGLRIAESRKKKGMTATELSKITGFSNGRISHWEQGRRLPNLDSILVLEKVLEVPASYLLCVSPDIELDKTTNYSIPLYRMTETSQRDTPTNFISISIPYDLNINHLFAVKLLDNSMADLFRKDDVIVFNSEKECMDGSFVLIQLIKTGQILFRKYVIDNSDINNPVFKLIALNPDFENIVSSHNDAFHFLGVYNDSIRLFL